jgi:hypothetical protein
MLGYVTTEKQELKMREYEIYRGYYCGVCKSIGKRYGQIPRLALSYDAAFLAMVLASLRDEPDLVTKEHCIIHPIKKNTAIRNEAIDYAADVMLILTWHKLQDDANDDKKVSAKAALTLMKPIYKNLPRPEAPFAMKSKMIWMKWHGWRNSRATTWTRYLRHLQRFSRRSFSQDPVSQTKTPKEYWVDWDTTLGNGFI